MEIIHMEIKSKNGNILRTTTADSLREADLHGADLYSLGFDQSGYHFLLYFEPEAVIRAGWRTFTMDQAKEYWERTHGDNSILKTEILGKLALAEAIIAARKKQEGAE